MTRAEPSVDLHAHTTASDGVLGPAALVDYALERGLTVLGVTDHDSTEGVGPALSAAEGTGLRVVPGVELNTDVPGGETHVLGYFVDHQAGWFQTRLTELRAGREVRGQKMVDRLIDAGIPMSWNRVLEIADGGAIGRPHVAQALVERGYASSVSDAFDRYLGRGRVAYVERARFTPVQAVEAIKKAGGAAVLAHPIFGADATARELALAELPHRLEELLAAGLKGLEVYYSGYDEVLVRALERIALERGLLRTGGSDFHGAGIGHADLGTVWMPPDVARTLVDDLQAAAG